MTFCTKNHELYFGDVVDGRMELSEIGEYALRCIEKIPEINDNVAVPEYVVMPNHIHMIVIVDNPIEWPDDEQLSQIDQRLPRCDSPTAQYLGIITRKTALLMRSCCVAGALSVNATPEQVQQISDFGLNFGILFQLRDDILDGENVEQAEALLPEYLEKTLEALKVFPASETLEVLWDLTVFCAERDS